MRVIDVPTFMKEREAGEVDVVVDVRTEAEWSNGHVPGAVWLPLQELVDRVSELQPYRDQTLHLICQSGGRSGRAGQYLESLGYDVVNIMGGTGMWIALGNPVER
tara:strand:- start:242 stop:556 length:315 start_codon:yes stop_codon:yes gene_type:complete